jgi:ABC-type nitrate/sulfonate/bicarbonate transport system substrate-binding protein
MRLFKPFLAGFAVLALLCVGAAPGRAEPAKLRIAWIVPAGDAPLALFNKPGIAKDEGKTYTLEFTHMTSTPAMITALASGAIDLVPFAYSTFALAIENAKMTDLRVIADVFQDGVDDHYSTKFMVLKDSPIKTIADLKGKVLTSNGYGSAVDIAMRAMMKKHGLNAGRDYTVIETAFPNMKAELLSHKVDLITGVQPFAEDPQLVAAARTLFTQKEAIGISQMIVLCAREEFIKKNRAALVDFLADNLRELAWYHDPAHHAEAIKTVADFTKTPEKLWSSWLFTKKELYHVPNGVPDLNALQRNIATAHELGFIKTALDPHKYADLSLIKDADKRFK